MVFDKINIYMEGTKILNLNNFKVIQGETTIYDEFENVAICNDGHIYGFGVKTLRMYDFVYKANIPTN